MISKDELVRDMMNSLLTGSHVQKQARALIKERSEELVSPLNIAAELAVVCDDFKYGAMRDLFTRLDKDNPSFRDEVKKIDNIINDISRISRETLNHSIVCVKRGKTYAGSRWVYMPKAVISKVPVPSTASTKGIFGTAVTLHEALSDMARPMEPSTEEELAAVIQNFLTKHPDATNHYMIFNKGMPTATLLRLVMGLGYTLPDMAKAMREIATEIKETESVT